jgi:putative inorganic carbon (hco3(-)) transporter
MESRKTDIFRNNGWIVIISLLFVIANIILIAHEWYFLSLLPFVFLIIYLSVIALDKLIYLIIFFTPVSIPLEMFDTSLGFNLQLPTEPILIWVLVLFFFRLIYEKKFDRQILLHPVSIAIYFYLLWIFFTSITSSMPIVSFKFLISRLWFVVSFYFIATQLFVTKKGIRTYVWIFMPLMIVASLYALVNMARSGVFNQQAAHLSAYPFFKDHTSYGCVLAMLIPFISGFLFLKRYTVPVRLLCWITIIILLSAFFLTYSRAAWMSIAVAAGILLLVLFRVRFFTIAIIGVIIGALLFANKETMFADLKRNRQNSSGDVIKHIESISNIQTDDSNVERLNRWKSAVRMFRERPFCGWGPGTYMFRYAPFQLSYDKTSISTNMGNKGNAHSEYLGALAESGIFGCLSFIFIGILSITTGIRLYTSTRGHRQARLLSLVATLGLITYYTHGFLNDFLDMDKASALFWGFTAMIVALDVYHIKKLKRDSD